MLSIIIPVYNVEKYLERCIKSVLKQDMNDYEIILVDDGATDRSGDICDKIAAASTNIKVIHKSNGGLSDARNVGLSNSKGDYVMFVDSDDTLRPNVIKKLYDTANANDLDVLSFAVDWIQDGVSHIVNSLNIESGKLYTGKEFLASELASGKFKAMAPKKIYSTKLLKGNNINFKKGIYHEDEQWTPRVLLAAKRVMQIDDIVYEYYIRGGSITTSTTNIMKRSQHLIEIVAEHYDLYYAENEPLKTLGLSYIANLYMSAVSNAWWVGEKFPWKYKYVKSYKSGLMGILRKTIFMISPKLYGDIMNRR